MSKDSPEKILIVDNDEDFIAWASKHLKAKGVEISSESNPEEAQLFCKKESPEVIIVEMRIEPHGGIELLKRLRQDDPNAAVILIADSPPTAPVIEAMRLGATEFLAKERLQFELRPVIESVMRAKEEIRSSEDSNATELDLQEEGSIIGKSAQMQEVFKMIGRVSRSDAPVLITGESGCGKELVAHAIHKYSSRSSREFIAVNCAAIPENLLESELFGHEKGSFTGATSRRIGRFEQGDSGSLFLDEIGDMPFTTQSKILRALQDGIITRVGGNDPVSTDVRIIAATNRNLESDVASGEFREDLFYRLNVVRIHLPPLRERLEDIPLLAEHFLQKISAESKRPKLRLTPEASDTLQAHHWPGNVRELENCMRRAAALSNNEVLLAEDIPFHPEAKQNKTGSPSSPNSALVDLIKEASSRALEKPMDWLEQKLLQASLELHEGDHQAAAKDLGMSAATLKKKLKSAT